jgi:zinc protease
MRLRAARFAAVAAVLAAAVAAGLPAAAREGDDPEVPAVMKVLKNGLTVVVHEDHKAPIVAVNVWYHVGSKNEKPGRTGFAHLFEHLMFNGSENYNDDIFKALVKLGTTGNNGTTNEDRTNYFETVPTGALDTVLWLESDRMGHLLGAIDQGKLDEQRGVVQNEKRQNENAPYGRIWTMLPALSYPQGHPYSWPVIGSMEDLNAASLADVKEWFRAYYGAANATLSVAGDVKTEEVIAKVEKYFGDIPPGPPVTRPEASIARRTGVTRWSVEERAPQPKLLKSWNTPGWGTGDSHLLELAAAVLARGEGSRLYQRLVWKERLATAVESEQSVNEIAGQFYVDVSVNAGADLGRVEAVLDEEMGRLIAEGPTEDELATEKTQARAALLRRLERIGGFGGKSDLLAESAVYGGSPDAWKRRMAAIAAATPASVRGAVKEWLSDGALVMEIEPVPPLAAAKEGADRSKVPEAPAPAEARFPKLQRAKLPNGLEVVLAERAGAAIVRAELMVGAGYADDPPALPGAARLTGALLSGGTKERSSLELRRRGDRLGADVLVETGLDATRVILSALRDGLDPSLGYLAEVALQPAFPADVLGIDREGQLADIAQEQVSPRGMVQRLLPRLLFGEGHPCAVPSSGSGTAAAVGKMTREDLAAFHGKWYRPGNATLVVAGSVSMAELLPVVQKHFGGWAAAEVPSRARPPAPEAAKSRIYLLDRPGAPQSSITAAQLVPARGGPEELPLDVLNAVFGGMFTSRLNMNLREDKHWSYGARSVVQAVRGPRPFLAQASVQTDRTAESLAEMLKEIRGVAGERPLTAAEMEAAATNMTLTLPGRWESARSVAESIEEILLFGLPDGYFDGYAGRIRAVKAEDLAAAGKLLRPDALVWIVCGDRRKVEEGLRKLGVAEVVVVDTDGKPVE